MTDASYLLRFAAILVVLVLAAWLYAVALPMAFLPSGYPSWVAKSEMLRTCQIGRIAFFGDSRTEAGVIPAQLPVESSNLGVAAGTAIETASAVRRALACPTPAAPGGDRPDRGALRPAGAVLLERHAAIRLPATVRVVGGEAPGCVARGHGELQRLEATRRNSRTGYATGCTASAFRRSTSAASSRAACSAGMRPMSSFWRRRCNGGVISRMRLGEERTGARLCRFPSRCQLQTALFERTLRAIWSRGGLRSGC